MASLADPVFDSTKLELNEAVAYVNEDNLLTNNGENDLDKNEAHNCPNTVAEENSLSPPASNFTDEIPKSEPKQPTPDKNESNSNGRKRKLKENENPTNKRSNYFSDSDSDETEVYFKLLIPSTSAGGVIGRGGEKIAQIQKDSNVKMKMSKTNDFYPNTCERICLIIGFKRSILKAHDFIVERIQEKQQQQPDSNLRPDSDMIDRLNQIKLLIPNTTAGLLIGKGGSFIKQIKEESGAFVQISPKRTDLSERIVTIEGEIEKRNRALKLVLNKIAEDPQHNQMKDSLSYPSHVNESGKGLNDSLSGHEYSSYGSANSSMNMTNNAGLYSLASLIFNSGGIYDMNADSLKISLRNSGYSGSAAAEIVEAITVLMSYGLINNASSQNGNIPFNHSSISYMPGNNGINMRGGGYEQENYSNYYRNNVQQYSNANYFNNSQQQSYQNNVYPTNNMQQSQSFYQQYGNNSTNVIRSSNSISQVNGKKHKK